MKAKRQRLLAVLVICGLTTFARAALPPAYDFTGQWSGTATERGTGQTGTLTADFAATTHPRRFTGSTTLVAGQSANSTCPLVAKYRKNLIVHSRCPGHPVTVVVHFDPTALTLSGSFPIGHHHIADFTLQRTP